MYFCTILNFITYNACKSFICRMYPVVIGNGRCMTKETVISGYKIPKGVSIHNILLYK